MALCRSEDDWSTLINEFNVCKRKLHSKRESLQIMMKELEQAQVEKDVYKNKARQLQRDFDEYRGKIGDACNNNDNSATLDPKQCDKKIKTLTNLLQYAQDENRKLKADLENIKQLYNESQHDNILLRSTLSKHENVKKLGATGIEDKEKLISKLEDSLSKITVLEEELQQLNDDKKVIQDEVQNTKEKNSRLNTELNYILHNDDKRIVDVDSLVLENEYLKEVVKQYKEEKDVASNTAARYREALKFKKQSGKSQSTTNEDTSEGFFSKSSKSTISDLQRVNKALTEKIAEKELALKHQRNTNRILGTRVSELEKKLKTLEISGLWSHDQRSPRFIPEDSFASDDSILTATSTGDEDQ